VISSRPTPSAMVRISSSSRFWTVALAMSAACGIESQIAMFQRYARRHLPNGSFTILSSAPGHDRTPPGGGS
jgi:hypothetical protein